MKLAIASDDDRSVAQHFGRCLGFTVVTLESDGVRDRRWMPQRATNHVMQSEHGQGHAHGHGHAQEHGHGGGHAQEHGHSGGHSHAGIIALLEGCDLVVGGGMGRRIRDDLASAGIQTVITDIHGVDEVIEAVRQDRLVNVRQGCAPH